MAITIPILTDFKGDGLDRGIAQFKKLEGTGAKAGFLIRKAALPAAAALGALGAGAAVAAKAAAEDAAAQEKLAGTLSRVTGASDAAVASTEDYISALSQSVGVADDELRPALGRLATATGDLSKAQELLGIALDVSAQTGKPLETVTTALSKAYGGNFGALNRLIPGFDQGIIKSKDFTKAQAELARLTGGAAAENANTAAGQFRKFQIALEETKESIGAALLPIFQAFLPILQKAAQFVQNNSDVVVVLGGVIAGLAGAILAANAAMTAYNAITNIVKAATVAWSVAQTALNLVLTANPIGVVVVAIGAIVAALVVAYQKSETFREAVQAVWNWLTKLWQIIDGPVELAFKGLKKYIEVALIPITAMIKTVERVIDLLADLKRAIQGTGGNPFAGGAGAGFGGTGGAVVTGPRTRMAVTPMNLGLASRSAPAAINVQVSAGLVSSPDQIGQQIIQAIQVAQRRSGPVFAYA
jgi:hypothetical protein